MWRVTALPFQGEVNGGPAVPGRCPGLEAALALRAEERADRWSYQMVLSETCEKSIESALIHANGSRPEGAMQLPAPGNAWGPESPPLFRSEGTSQLLAPGIAWGPLPPKSLRPERAAQFYHPTLVFAQVERTTALGRG